VVRSSALTDPLFEVSVGDHGSPSRFGRDGGIRTLVSRLEKPDGLTRAIRALARPEYVDALLRAIRSPQGTSEWWRRGESNPCPRHIRQNAVYKLDYRYKKPGVAWGRSKRISLRPSFSTPHSTPGGLEFALVRARHRHRIAQSRTDGKERGGRLPVLTQRQEER